MMETKEDNQVWCVSFSIRKQDLEQMLMKCYLNNYTDQRL